MKRIIILLIGAIALSSGSANAMNKAELIDAIASKSGLNKSEATRAVNLMLQEIKTAVVRGERVMLPEFGTFVPQSAEETTKGGIFIPDSSFNSAMKVRPMIKRRSNN